METLFKELKIFLQVLQDNPADMERSLGYSLIALAILIIIRVALYFLYIILKNIFKTSTPVYFIKYLSQIPLIAVIAAIVFVFFVTLPEGSEQSYILRIIESLLLVILFFHSTIALDK